MITGAALLSAGDGVGATVGPTPTAVDEMSATDSLTIMVDDTGMELVSVLTMYPRSAAFGFDEGTSIHIQFAAGCGVPPIEILTEMKRGATSTCTSGSVAYKTIKHFQIQICSFSEVLAMEFPAKIARMIYREKNFPGAKAYRFNPSR